MHTKIFSSFSFKFFTVLAIIALVLAGLPAQTVHAASCTFTSAATGNWNAAGTWTAVGTGCSTYPGQTFAGDTVNISSGNTVTLNVTPAQPLASITFLTNNNNSAILNFGNGTSLSVTGTITIPRATNNGAVNTLAVGSGTLTAGNIAFTNGGNQNQPRHALTISTGTVTVTGNVTQTGSNGSATITFTGAGTLNLGGSFLNSGNGTLNTVAGSTVVYNGAAQTVGDFGYQNLTLAGSGAKTITNGATVAGNLTTSGTATAATPSNLTIGGNLTVGSGTTLTAAANFTFGVTGTTSVSGTLTLAGTGNKTFTGNVTVNNGGTWNETGVAAYTFAGNLQNDGTFTASTGVHTFSGANKTISGANAVAIPNLTVGGTTTNNGTLTVSTALAGAGTLTNGATGTLNYGGTTAIVPTLIATAAGNKVNYNGGGAQTVKATTYSILNLSTSGAKAIATGTSIGGNIDISGTALANIGAGLTIPANSLSFAGVGQVPGTWGSTSSAATNKNNTYFSATTGMLNVATGTVPAPTVTNVTSTTANGAYTTGASVVITVTFNQVVSVSGTPQLTLETGATDRVANYTSGSGTNTLTFTYTVQAGDTSVDLDYWGTNALALNGGTIKNASTIDANLTLPTPGAAGSLGANKAIVIDTTAPDTTISTTPTNPSTATSASFSFTGTDGGSGVASFQCQLDGGTFATCTSPQAYAGLSDGSHTFQVRAVDAAGNTDATPASFTWVVDTLAPDTTINTSPANPTNNTTATFTFSGSDGSGTGVAGFECQLNGGGFSTCTSPQTYNGLGNGSHTFQVRAVDNAGNKDASPASYTWTVNTSAPDTTITSKPGNPDNNPNPSFGFTSTDATATFECAIDGGAFAACTSPKSYSGLADGSHTFNVRAVSSLGNADPSPASYTWVIDTTTPDTTLGSTPANPSTSATAAFTFTSPDATATFQCSLDGAAFVACTSPQSYTGLSGGSHTFQVRAVDGSANVDPSPASFTWVIDLGYPALSTSSPANNAKASANLTTLTVTFSKDVKNNGSAGAANNVVNYLLVEAGTNGVFNTLSCSGGLVADDTKLTINSAAYDNKGGSGPFVATLTVNPLAAGTYRLFVCGTTSIEDLAGNKLNNGASDAQVNFTITSQNNDSNNSTSQSTKKTSGALFLPVTGFPMDTVTLLPEQPADAAYSSTDLLLEIPSLGVKMSIVGVPYKDGKWDVTWLDKNAGWLNNSAYPTWNGNSVITGHVWDALNQPGPFAGLKKLKYGDKVRIHAFGQIYIYEVRESTTVLPSNVSSVFKHQDKPWITLITCEDYKEATQTYAYRRMVRAVLVSVTEE